MGGLLGLLIGSVREYCEYLLIRDHISGVGVTLPNWWKSPRIGTLKNWMEVWLASYFVRI